MEAAGAPRLDVERLALVRRSTRGAGQRGLPRRDKCGKSFPAHAVAVAEERSARLHGVVSANCALGTLAY
jgi:hypothetical protein